MNDSKVFIKEKQKENIKQYKEKENKAVKEKNNEEMNQKQQEMHSHCIKLKDTKIQHIENSDSQHKDLSSNQKEDSKHENNPENQIKVSEVIDQQLKQEQNFQYNKIEIMEILKKQYRFMQCICLLADFGRFGNLNKIIRQPDEEYWELDENLFIEMQIKVMETFLQQFEPIQYSSFIACKHLSYNTSPKIKHELAFLLVFILLYGSCPQKIESMGMEESQQLLEKINKHQIIENSDDNIKVRTVEQNSNIYQYNQNQHPLMAQFNNPIHTYHPNIVSNPYQYKYQQSNPSTYQPQVQEKRE